METNGVSHHHHTKGYLQPGDRAPEFKGTAAVLKNGDVSEMEIKLSNYSGKYVVFFFYPQDFTFVCPTEIIAFSERVEEFKKINCEVIGCSTDSYNCHRAWMKTPRNAGGLGDIHIPLLADPSHVIAKVNINKQLIIFLEFSLISGGKKILEIEFSRVFFQLDHKHSDHSGPENLKSPGQ